MCLLISKGIKHQTHDLSLLLRLLQMLLKNETSSKEKKKSAVSRSNLCLFFPKGTLFNHSLIQKYLLRLLIYYVIVAVVQLPTGVWLCNPTDCSTPGLPPCLSPPPRVCPSSCSLRRCYHPAISPSVALLSSCLQSFPASGPFPMSRPFASGDPFVMAKGTV